MSVSDWSATADENTTVDGINIAEHCPAKNINNAIRSVMAALKTKCDALDATDNTLRRGAVIGEIRWFAMSTPPTGWLVCNGAAVGTSDYPALFAAIGNTFLPEDVSASPATFKLPNLMGKVPWGSTSVGTVLDAGLPNIIGFLGDSYGSSGAFWGVSGAFRERKIGKRFKRTEDTNHAEMDVDFNASWSNPIYGKSSTVQPPALCLLPCIRYE